MADTAAQLAREIADLKRRLAAVERSSQLGRSSVDAGTLVVNDENGQPVIAVGRQADGTYAVVGANGGKVVADTVPQEVLDELASQLQLADGAVTEAKLAADAVTTTKIADDAITSPKIVAGAIQAGQIAAGAVLAGNIAADAVDADAIAANAVTADKIAANSITADRLSVGTLPENVVIDGSFEDSAVRVSRLASVVGGTWSFIGTSPFDGSFSARVSNTAGGTARMFLSDPFPVTPGDIYNISYAARGSVGATGGANCLLRVVDSSGGVSFLTAVATTANGNWATVQGTGTIPANAVTAQICIQSDSQTAGTWDFDAVDVRRQLTGVAIAGGTIAGSTLLIDTPSNASVKIDGETGEFILTGTAGKKLKLVPSNINPEVRFYSKNENTFAFINQPSTADGHAPLGVNSGAYKPPDGVDRVLRMFLNSQFDLGHFECIRRSDQALAGGYVAITSTDMRAGIAQPDGGPSGNLYFDENGLLWLFAETHVQDNMTVTGAITWGTPGAVAVQDATGAGDFGQTTSTSYTADLSGGTTPGVAFVAPPSGKVMVAWGALCTNNTAGAVTMVGWEIRTGSTVGSGTVVSGYGASDDRRISNKSGTASSDDAEFGSSYLVTGLTPGVSYNIRQMYRVSGGSGTYLNKRISVMPTL